MEGKFIIYQLLLRVFGNRNENCVSNGSLSLNGTGKFSSVDAKVFDYLKKLNITHIWYTGVIEHSTKEDFSQYGIKKDDPSLIKGMAGSPYAIKDYYDVNPYLADNVNNRMQEFEQLIERSHKNGFKVIIDFVPNHLARQYYSDQLPQGQINFGEQDNLTCFTPDNNFYYLPNETFVRGTYTETPAKATGNNCFTATPSENDWYETIKLNYGVDYNSNTTHFNPIPRTWKMMYNILCFWAAKGVDGFRCDMAELVPVEFWHWCIAKVKENYNSLCFIAEVYNPTMYDSYLNFGGFDYLYDKVGLYDTLKRISRAEGECSQITGNWQSLGDMQYKMLNFLENHDEQRIASDFNLGNPFKGIPELVVSLMFNKSPFMLYFGQELGEDGMQQEGFSGLDGRTSIFDFCSCKSINSLFANKLTDSQKELLEYYTKLLYFATSSSALKYGDTYDLQYANYYNENFNSSKCFVFARKSRFRIEDINQKNELVIIAVDFSQNINKASVNLPDHFFKHWDIPCNIAENGKLDVCFNKYGVSITKFDL